MRTVKILGFIVAILGLLTALVALLTEGLKLYRELPTQAPQIVTVVATNPQTSAKEVMWQDLGIFYATGATTIGNQDKWMVFQVWDGINTSSTVHGIIEPGYFLVIPTIVQGTTWMVSGYSNEYMFNRVIQMRDEAVQLNKMSVPPLLYIGSNSTPSGFITQLPNGWSIK